jgi:hypothetical protein
MKRYKLIFFILFVIVLYIITKILYKEKYTNQMLNIYNEPLKSCAENNMFNGSWDNTGKCSELDGGVHQICIKNISKNTSSFSKITGQSDWSNKRGNNNHCVCLGAWSLYNSKIKNNKMNVLKCNAIPKNALSKQYVSKFSEGWNKWNNLEMKNQIKNGVESLVKNCYNSNISNAKKKGLKDNYCNFSKNIISLNNTPLYKKICK